MSFYEINCVSDEIAQVGTNLSPTELQFFKKIVDKIMENDRHQYQISSIEALNCNSLIQPTISKQTAERALDKFLADHWLLEM
jgi:cell fate (sporulation/competence/biofilm development) regulator YmcA (YheA/YmcA/DUF963 family)